MTPLNPQQLEPLLADLPDWQWDRAAGKIQREFRFADFSQAFGFMAEMATHSERLNHHPEWFNVYNRLSVTLTTHDAGGLTQLDVDWATLADAAARQRTA